MIENLPNVINFVNDKYNHLSGYRNVIDDSLTTIYNKLCGNKKFMSWITCDVNSYDNLYEEFIKLAQDILLDNYYLFGENTDLFRTYNVMTQKEFYNVWTNDLLTFMVNQARKEKI